ncbi:hypothetical protein MMB68_01485 [Priestia sp. Y58]|uniref:hypothetical protein n=1 Tax=Priestia TaxID=2800373 RepID=UPI0004702229|nr:MULTISPECIES: hypothetical protein [Priestia]TCN16033.1 hypothetical protein EV581_101863 [Bacillus sp. BK006]MBX9999523.1 hypothetical protein [Priestia aryabhattai]MCM3017103.1 hypothetical protein [Priestia megaterium]MCM3182654.1 hypothetical protein [Priestia megaterium]MCM3192788.1 hypothetical protein [Priestia megaterium]
MEFSLQSHESAVPCEIVADEENGRYMLRKADTSGEVFNTPSELIEWIEANWSPEQFVSPAAFHEMMKQLKSI